MNGLCTEEVFVRRCVPRGEEVQRDGEGGRDQQPDRHRAHSHEAFPSPEERVHRRLRPAALPVSLCTPTPYGDTGGAARALNVFVFHGDRGNKMIRIQHQFKYAVKF